MVLEPKEVVNHCNLRSVNMKSKDGYDVLRNDHDSKRRSLSV
jgi:hypothetical protein